MELRKNPISRWWLVPYSLVFSGSSVYFLFRVFQDIENIFGFILFSLLLIAFSLVYKKFSITFEEEGIRINQIFRKNFVVPYKAITGAYIRQTPFQRVLGLQSLIVRFEAEEQRERVNIRAFGFSYQYYGLSYFPGVWGELLTVPDINKRNLELLERELHQRARTNITQIGIGYPIYDKVVKLRFIITWGLILIFVLIVGLFFVLKILILFTS